MVTICMVVEWKMCPNSKMLDSFELLFLGSQTNQKALAVFIFIFILVAFSYQSSQGMRLASVLLKRKM